MTGCFVNIRGVEHPDKQRFLRVTIREEGVCFIGLCETIKGDLLLIGLRKYMEIEILFGKIYL
jgi:hypothetical protein